MHNFPRPRVAVAAATAAAAVDHSPNRRLILRPIRMHTRTQFARSHSTKICREKLEDSPVSVFFKKLSRQLCLRSIEASSALHLRGVCDYPGVNITACHHVVVPPGGSRPVVTAAFRRVVDISQGLQAAFPCQDHPARPNHGEWTNKIFEINIRKKTPLLFLSDGVSRAGRIRASARRQVLRQ